MDDETKPKGAWVVVGWDMRAYPVALFDNALDAYEYNAENNIYGEVYFWPWGSWDDRRKKEEE